MSHRRFSFSWWGATKRFTMPKWAVVIDDEAPLTAIKRAITNATGYGIVSSCVADTVISPFGRPIETHYELTLGRPCKSGGSAVAGRVWVAVPAQDGGAPE